jgi:predicted HTH domain antitoxin
VHAAEKVAEGLAHDAPLRAQYMREVKEFSAAIIKAFESGTISEGEAARLASSFRNQAMNETRAGLSPAGKVLSSYLKSEGKTLAQLVEKYAVEAGKTTATLTAEDKGKIFLQIANKAGVTNETVNVGSKLAPHMGKALLAVGVAIAFYQVWKAENPEREAVKQAAAFAGFAYGAAAGASAGLLCGPGAPLCSVVFGIAGGLLVAITAEKVAEKAYDHGAVTPVPRHRVDA